MFRVMIIDDEEPTRLLLKESIDWQSLGLELLERRQAVSSN